MPKGEIVSVKFVYLAFPKQNHQVVFRNSRLVVIVLGTPEDSIQDLVLNSPQHSQEVCLHSYAFNICFNCKDVGLE